MFSNTELFIINAVFVVMQFLAWQDYRAMESWIINQRLISVMRYFYENPSRGITVVHSEDETIEALEELCRCQQP